MPNEEIKIAILEQRLVDFVTVVNKLEQAINKINDVNSNILKMLAVQNEKIEQFYIHSDRLNSRVDDVSDRNDDSISFCLKKIDDLESKFDKLPDMDHITQKLDDVLRVKWMVVGIGAVLVTVTATLSQLASGVWTNNVPKARVSQSNIERTVDVTVAGNKLL